MSARSATNPDSDSEPGTRSVQRWIASLRTGCETLRRAQPQMIGSVVLTQLLTDLPWEAATVPPLARQLAAEYDLDATVERGARHLTVRLTRRGGPKVR